MNAAWFDHACSLSITHREALEWLYVTASEMTPPVLVCEIGCWRGGSTIVLAQAIYDAGGGAVFAVDNWSHMNGEPIKPEIRREFDSNISSFGDIVSVHDQGSPDAADDIPDDSLDLIFVDGSHTKQDVLRDLRAFCPKLKAGGIFCGHDYGGEPGVREAVSEFFGPHVTGAPGDLWIAKQVRI